MILVAAPGLLAHAGEGYSGSLHSSPEVSRGSFLQNTGPGTFQCGKHLSVCLSVCLSIYLSIYFIALPAPKACGGSQARGLIGAIAAGLHESHSNAGSEPRLRPIPQPMATLDP